MQRSSLRIEWKIFLIQKKGSMLWIKGISINLSSTLNPFSPPLFLFIVCDNVRDNTTTQTMQCHYWLRPHVFQKSRTYLWNRQARPDLCGNECAKRRLLVQCYNKSDRKKQANRNKCNNFLRQRHKPLEVKNKCYPIGSCYKLGLPFLIFKRILNERVYQDKYVCSAPARIWSTFWE